MLARAHVIDVKFTGGLVSNGTLDHAELSVVALVLGWGCGGRRKERKEQKEQKERRGRRGRQEERGGAWRRGEERGERTGRGVGEVYGCQKKE